MVKSAALKARVEDRIGAALPADVFDQAEQYARRKLALINARAGRQYGEDGYGDEYLVILAVEIVREMALTAYLNGKGAAV